MGDAIITRAFESKVSDHQIFVGMHALPRGTRHSTVTLLYAVVVLICLRF